ncbi:MAG: TIR domain-containing protein [Anaerolineae bacterium]|nr:TIR domain-containing protein [Anaerolineae bacterium]
MTTDKHIFISYARHDGREQAEYLITKLKALDIPAWYDTRNLSPDQDFTAELEKAIEGASHVVVCVTPDTKRDDSYVRREISYACNKFVNKPIIPLMFAELAPQISIINLTYIDFVHQSWDTAFSELIQRLNRPSEAEDYGATSSDPFHDYLDALYHEIVQFLDASVFTLTPLLSKSVPGKVVEKQVPALLHSFMKTTLILRERKSDERTFNTFVEAFEACQGRLLLLGEAGTGKTITLMAFARDAVAHRLAHPTRPLPMLARIADWNAQEAVPMATWLSALIGQERRSEVEKIITDGQALFLLDGLDELSGIYERHKETNPLLKFIQLIPSNNQVVISCRAKVYETFEAKAPLNGAMQLQSLSDSQIETYLHDDPDLWQALRTDNNLRELARTPLVLSIFTYAYRELSTETAKLRDLQNSPSELQNKIWMMYVERRNEHEKLKTSNFIGYTNEQIYSILGEAASIAINPSLNQRPTSSYDFANNIFSILENDAQNFIDTMCSLHILVRFGKSVDFIHLLLRNHFAASYCLPLLNQVLGTQRIEAAYVLGYVGDDRAINPIIAALRTASEEDVYSLGHALMRFGRKAIEAMLATLNSGDLALRIKIIDAFSQLKESFEYEMTQRAEMVLIKALYDPHPQIQIHAAKSIGIARIYSADLELQSAFYTVNTLSVRAAIVEALTAITTSGAELSDMHIKFLIDAANHENDPAIRGILAGALLKVDDVINDFDEEGLLDSSVQQLIDYLADARFSMQFGYKFVDKNNFESGIIGYQLRVCDVAAMALTAIGTIEAKQAVEIWRASDLNAFSWDMIGTYFWDHSQNLET